MDRRVTPPKRVTSPSWGPPPPCKQVLFKAHARRTTTHVNRFMRYSQLDKRWVYNLKCSRARLTRRLQTLNVYCLEVFMGTAELKHGLRCFSGANRPLAHTARAQDTSVCVKGLNESPWPLACEVSKAICRSSELPTEFKQSVSDQLKSLVGNIRNASVC